MLTDVTGLSQIDDICIMFREMGFDPDVASSANVALYGKNRSKKAKHLKYLEALWSAHSKHGKTPDVAHILKSIGATAKYKLQPELGRVEIRTALSYVDLYSSLEILPQLGGDAEDRAREIARIVDQDDGLPFLAPDLAAAIIHIAVSEYEEIKKEDVCKAFGRSTTPVTRARKAVQAAIGDRLSASTSTDYTDSTETTTDDGSDTLSSTDE